MSSTATGSAEPHFAAIAALIGDPARANILKALMDGRARTAKELAFAAGVTPQTTSGHLAKLLEGKLLEVANQGRHRYYRLANALVADAIESMMALAGERILPRHRQNRALTGALRQARTCYDHLAGRLGVGIHDCLLARGHILPADSGAHAYRLAESGRHLLEDIGIDIAAVARQRRGFARPCLDWSERVPHLAGGLGAAIAGRCFALGWIERQRDSRAVIVTSSGRDGLGRLFGIDMTPPPCEHDR